MWSWNPGSAAGLLTSGLRLCLLRFGEEPDLLHQAESVVAGPVFDDLAVGDALDGDARNLYPVAGGGPQILRLTVVGAFRTKAADDLVPVGHLVLYGDREVGESVAVGCCVLLCAVYAPCFAEGGIVEDVVGGVELPGGVQIPPLVEHLVKLPAHQGFVVF